MKAEYSPDDRNGIFAGNGWRFAFVTVADALIHKHPREPASLRHSLRSGKSDLVNLCVGVARRTMGRTTIG